MSRVFTCADAHLGHDNAIKWRPQFSTPEEHHETIFDNIATTVGKRDSIIFLGDIALSHEWLMKLKEIKCMKKTLILGNHDSDKKDCMKSLLDVYDEIHSHKNYKSALLSHCPIHIQEFRKQIVNVHGHTHGRLMLGSDGKPDPLYLNVSMEQLNYKPVDFKVVKEYIDYIENSGEYL